MSGQVITPWDVQGEVIDGVAQAVDYEKIVQQFGSKLISAELIARFEKVTGHKPHRFLRRGIFYSHRDLNLILDMYEKGKPFYLYTGRGPSSDSLHAGHMVPLILTQWMQEVFDVPLVFQMTDDEKFIFKNLDLDEAAKCSKENMLDVLATGYDIEKTFMFNDTDYIKYLMPNVMKCRKVISINENFKAFGFERHDAVGKFAHAAVQMAPCFSNTFPHIFGEKKDIPCLIPCAIDQDVYFRITRDIASGLKYKKPALIHCSFFPALQGAASKMSSSDANSAIFLNDTAEMIRCKLANHAKVATTKLADGTLDLSEDVLIEYLRFYLEDDDVLEKVKHEYKTGKMQKQQVVDLLSDILIEFVETFQKRRNAMTINDLMRVQEVRDMSQAYKNSIRTVN